MQITKTLEKLKNRKLNESVDKGGYDSIPEPEEQLNIEEKEPGMDFVEALRIVQNATEDSTPILSKVELSRRLSDASKRLTTNRLSFEVNTRDLPDMLIQNLNGLRNQALQGAKNNNKEVTGRYLQIFKEYVNLYPEISKPTKKTLIDGLVEDANKILDNQN
jgi:hypothetical protein